MTSHLLARYRDHRHRTDEQTRLHPDAELQIHQRHRPAPKQKPPNETLALRGIPAMTRGVTGVQPGSAPDSSTSKTATAVATSIRRRDQRPRADRLADRIQARHDVTRLDAIRLACHVLQRSDKRRSAVA